MADMFDASYKDEITYIRMEYIAGGGLDEIQALIGPMYEDGARFFME